MIRRYLYRGRHRAPVRQMTLGEHAFWTTVASVAVATAVLAGAYIGSR